MKINISYDMKINIKKTKIMRISSGKANSRPKYQYKWKGIGNICYLGSMITSDAKCHVDLGLCHYAYNVDMAIR